MDRYQGARDEVSLKSGRNAKARHCEIAGDRDGPTSDPSVAVEWAARTGGGRSSGGAYPMLPVISSWISRLSSMAYSIGSSLVTGSMKPLTIMAAASSSEKPRDCM